MGEDAEDSSHAVGGKDVKILHCFHFKTEGGIDEKESQIGCFSDIDHTVKVVGAFNKG